MKTTEIRTAALESFVECFNLCYPDWSVGGDPSRALTTDDIEYSYTTSNLGRCGPKRDGRVYFAVNSSWYANATAGERVGLLLHELAHVQHTDHSPAFWQQVVENYEALAADAEVVEQVVLGDLAWNEVDEYLVNDPHTGLVDNRSEIAYERRRELADALDYPTEKVTPFDNMNIYVERTKGFQKVSLCRLRFEKKSLDEVVSYFHTRPREYLDFDGSRYLIQPLVGNEYELLDGHEMATLADIADIGHVYVDI